MSTRKEKLYISSLIIVRSVVLADITNLVKLYQKYNNKKRYNEHLKIYICNSKNNSKVLTCTYIRAYKLQSIK